MFLPLTLRVARLQGRLIDLILSAVLLLQQRHSFRLGIPTAAGDAVQVYAAGNTGAGDVGAVGCGRAVDVVLPHRLG